ncbi:protein disulfide-isomerase [Psychromonas hadalis]|uniref:protein disulfide-isomerase n=1 Tax=Psychromonas hadalis TaxID=211669 RepID=UPI0003B42AA0|nr:protein disulfide-isomerase [Psychromonas hadalis]
MHPELYFIYDSHCPWSYATTPLVNALSDSFPELEVHNWHCAHYDGSDCAGFSQIKAAEKQSGQTFGQEHIRFADSPKNAILTANFMAWLQDKQPEKVLPILNALQKEHFVEGNPFGCKRDFNTLVAQFKLSPPNKVFKEVLSNEALYQQSDIQELQAFMQNSAFPALLLTYGDNAILLEHASYLNKPQDLVKVVKKLLA